MWVLFSMFRLGMVWNPNDDTSTPCGWMCSVEAMATSCHDWIVFLAHRWVWNLWLGDHDVSWKRQGGKSKGVTSEPQHNIYYNIYIHLFVSYIYWYYRYSFTVICHWNAFCNSAHSRIFEKCFLLISELSTDDQFDVVPHWCEISKIRVTLRWCEICPLMWEKRVRSYSMLK